MYQRLPRDSVPDRQNLSLYCVVGVRTRFNRMRADVTAACSSKLRRQGTCDNVRTGPKSLRFQPYRLENSRCWRNGDARITCVACHDPHRPLVTEAASYDERCLACRVTEGKVTADHPGAACPTSKKNCVTCHMPQYKVEDIPVKFTDHQIRVVRGDAPIPE